MSDSSNRDGPPKKTLKSLAQGIASQLPRASDNKNKKPPLESEGSDASTFVPPTLSYPFQPTLKKTKQTYALRLDRIKKLSDEQLMQYLTRESVPSDGELDDGTKMAITMELMRRQSEEASQPHRPTFWMLVVSLVLTFLFGVWGVVKDVRNSNPPPQQAAPTEPQAPIDSKTQPDRS